MHSEQPELHRVLAALSVTELNRPPMNLSVSNHIKFFVPVSSHKASKCFELGVVHVHVFTIEQFTNILQSTVVYIRISTVKILKIGTPEIITIIVLQLEQLDFTVQYCVQKMQTE